MLTGAKKNLMNEKFFEGKELTADSNYHSFESLTFCRSEGVDAFIPDLQFRKRDGRFAKQERFQDGIHGRQRQEKSDKTFSVEDFKPDDTRQIYLCPQGKELTLHARNQRNRYRLYDVYHARPEDCADCPVRRRCLSQSSASRRYLSVQVKAAEPNVLDEMKTKIDSPRGKKIYARQLGIVEPVFANICVHKHMNRFTLRSKAKVDVQ